MTNEDRLRLGERHPAVLLWDQELAWQMAHAVNNALKGVYGIKLPELEGAVRNWFRAHEGISG